MSAKQVNKWLITVTVMLPTIMEIIDTSVANVALPHIQGNLNAGLDEVSWVLTSYLVSNAVVLPMTGWLARMFGRKRVLITCISGFTISSLLCGMSPNIETLIFFRIVQGASGGILVPYSQAILMETFPPAQQGLAMAIFGVGAMTGPIVGPALGGWITDNMSWRWIFYINLPIGIIAASMARFFIFDPEYLKEKVASIDYWGLALLTIGLGSLQVVLDKGQREDWFSSSFIIAFSIIAAVALMLLVLVELRHAHPIVNLRLFKDRNFAAGNFTMFMFGFGLYSTLMLLPLFLQTLMGYTATLAGFVVAPGGLATLITMPVVGILLSKYDGRWLILAGCVICAWSMFMMREFNLEGSFSVYVEPRLLLGVGLGLVFVPLSTITLGSIAKSEMGGAAGLFNLLRNIGGGVGIAFAATFLERLSQFYQNTLAAHVTPFDNATSMTLKGLKEELMRRGMDATTAANASLELVYAEVRRQAAMLAYNHIFWIVGLAFLAVIPFLLLLRRQAGGGPPGAH